MKEDKAKAAHLLTVSAKLQKSTPYAYSVLGVCFAKGLDGLEASAVRSVHYIKPLFESGEKGCSVPATMRMYAMCLLQVYHICIILIYASPLQGIVMHHKLCSGTVVASQRIGMSNLNGIERRWNHMHPHPPQ